MKICLDMRYKTESGGSTYVKEVAERLLRIDRTNEYVLLKYRDQLFPFEHMALEILISPRWLNPLELLWTATILPFRLQQRGVDVHHGLKAPVPYWNSAATVTTMHSTHDSYKSEYHNSLKMKLFFKLYGNHVWRYRPKEGFTIPIKNWLGSQFRHAMENALNPERIRNEGLFKPETISRLKEEHLSGRANHSHILWSLIVFQSWRSMWYEG